MKIKEEIFIISQHKSFLSLMKIDSFFIKNLRLNL